MLSQLIEQADQLPIVDMEASVEHMSRGTIRHADILLIVTEP
jgi:CO dehydrogenase nickel-insertion accessory protein CooC1